MKRMIALCAALAVLMTVGCSQKADTGASILPPNMAKSVSETLESETFEDFDVMVVTADTVALVTVTSVEITPEPTPDPSGPRDVGESVATIDLQLDEVLASKGSPPLPDEFTILNNPSWSYGAHGESGREWRYEGQQVIVFLRRSPAAAELGRPFWQLQDSQAVFRVEGDDIMETAKEKALSTAVGKWTVAQFKTRAAQAAERGKSGEVKPRPD